MDPNTNLTAQRDLAKRVLAAYDNPDGNGIDQDDATDLAELMHAMDLWLSKGGFLPDAWKR